MYRIEFINPDDYEPGEPIPLPDDIKAAIRCLDLSKLKPRNWRAMNRNDMTQAERAMSTLEEVARVPSGMLVGRPLRFMFFQEIILYILIDMKPSLFVLSLARRNGKTFILAVLTLLYLISELALKNSLIASAAMSRDQAALLFKEIQNMIEVSPKLKPFIKVVPSGKRLIGLVRNVEYQALAAEAKTGFGRSFRVVVLDEAGQIVGPDNDYISMLRTSQGSIEEPLFAVISTQAASDSDYLSVTIDTCIRDQPEDAAVLVFETPKEYDIEDEEGWYYSNPGLGIFRSLKDMRNQALTAKRVPESEARFQNLNLNRRIALHGLWISPTAWKECAQKPDLEVFRSGKVALGMDLSVRTDLTAAVFAAKDAEGYIHLIPHVFVPLVGIEQRELRDKAPYQYWVKEGFIIGVPSTIIEYDWVAKYLKKWCKDNGIEPSSIEFDRWRIDVLKREFENIEAFTGIEWNPVGQGYRDMSPRIEHFESLILSGRLKHGAHPLMNLGASSAVVVSDPSGNRKVEKSKTSQRIDMIVAALMAGYGLEQTEFADIDSWIG